MALTTGMLSRTVVVAAAVAMAAARTANADANAVIAVIAVAVAATAVTAAVIAAAVSVSASSLVRGVLRECLPWATHGQCDDVASDVERWGRGGVLVGCGLRGLNKYQI